jgi:hypothetical protein
MMKPNAKTSRLPATLAGALCLLALALLPCGCTSRAVTVTSLPPGTEVSINRRVVGQTPIRVNYTHYGAYRMELRKERYQPLVRVEKLRPPYAYGYDPLAFFADNLVPARITDESHMHYILEPVSEKTDRVALMQRAVQARQGKAVHPQTQEVVEVALPAARGTPAEAPAVKPPPDVKPAPPKPPPDRLPPPAPPGKRLRRLPTGEILIYDEPPIEDPEKKKLEPESKR